MGVIAFDLGGTLMEYKGMPYSWGIIIQRDFMR